MQRSSKAPACPSKRDVGLLFSSTALFMGWPEKRTERRSIDTYDPDFRSVHYAPKRTNEVSSIFGPSTMFWHGLGAPKIWQRRASIQQRRYRWLRSAYWEKAMDLLHAIQQEDERMVVQSQEWPATSRAQSRLDFWAGVGCLVARTKDVVDLWSVFTILRCN